MSKGLSFDLRCRVIQAFSQVYRNYCAKPGSAIKKHCWQRRKSAQILRLNAVNGTNTACLKCDLLQLGLSLLMKPVKTNMTPLRGRGRKGGWLIADAPFGKWHTQTFIAGLRCDELGAPWVINGAINGEIFDIYVTIQLAPTLKPGDLVIRDSLNVH